MSAQTTVPFELYVKSGEPETGDYQISVTSVAGATADTTAITLGATAGSGESYVYQTGYNLIVPAYDSNLSGSAWTAWDGDDEITATTGMDIVVAIITTATGKAVHAGKTVVVANDEA